MFYCTEGVSGVCRVENLGTGEWEFCIFDGQKSHLCKMIAGYHQLPPSARALGAGSLVHRHREDLRAGSSGRAFPPPLLGPRRAPVLSSLLLKCKPYSALNKGNCRKSCDLFL